MKHGFSLKAPNNACSRQVGLGAFLSLFLASSFFRLPSRVLSRPLAANAKPLGGRLIRINEKEMI
jgi:hypothetical protein